MSLAPPLQPPTPNCPRCAYELSGAVATWTDSCPLAGTCPECGLAFAWPDILDPARANLPGFIEHARDGVWTLFKSAWRTWAWAMLPWVFWRKVRLEHRIVPRRWVVWMALTLGVVVVLTWSVDGITQTTARAIKIADHRRILANFAQHPGPPVSTAARGIPAAAFSGPPPELWSTGHLVNMFDRWTYPFSLSSQSAFNVENSFVAVPGNWKGIDGTDLVPEPRWVYWKSYISRPIRHSALYGIGRLPPTLVPVVAWHVIFGLVLLALPTTRRLARVRRRHVLRAFVFGIAWWPGLACTLFLILSMDGLLELVDTINRQQGFLRTLPGYAVRLHVAQALQYLSGFLVSLFVPLHALIWWPLAILRGWRFTQGWLVVVIVAIPAGITAFCGFVLWQIARMSG